MPALRAIARAYPDHELSLATSSALEPLLKLADIDARVVPTSGLQAPLRYDDSPEVAVNLHGSGPQSHRLLLGLHPGRLVAFGCAELDSPGPRWDPDEHETARWCRLVTAELGASADPGDLLLRPPSAEPALRDCVVIHPGAAYPARRWPPDRFAAVAGWARSQGWPVVVTGSSAEKPLADLVARDAQLSAGAVLAGRTDLEELAALVASARLVVCGDTGLAHLASAYAVPSVLLFGPTPPHRWGPPAQGPHVVLWKGSDVGDPFGTSVDPALREISVADVVRAVGAVTERATRAPGSTTTVS